MTPELVEARDPARQLTGPRQECRDLDHAEVVACATAAEVGRDALPQTEDRKVIIEVRNERKQRVLTATVSLEVIRVDPQPS